MILHHQLLLLILAACPDLLFLCYFGSLRVQFSVQLLLQLRLTPLRFHHPVLKTAKVVYRLWLGPQGLCPLLPQLSLVPDHHLILLFLIFNQYQLDFLMREYRCSPAHHHLFPPSSFSSSFTLIYHYSFQSHFSIYHFLESVKHKRPYRQFFNIYIYIFY